ncbi:MAG: hypothetical protein M3Q89_04235 [Verrucomicrobiota bacterium]|nr:hypothetical protein [Verrucomicrobiota bacterium]
MHRRSFLAAFSLASLAALTGCQTTNRSEGIHSTRFATADSVKSEPPGDYYIGRRYFKNDYKFWGYVRRPGQPWSSSQLVMFNEKQKLAPDRAQNSFGSDHNYEYKLYGDFSGDKVYEPASNGIYPEFVLKNYELLSTNPPAIFKSQYDSRAQAALGRLTIEKPE